MDVYALLCRRLSYLNRPAVVPLASLNDQLGFKSARDEQGLSSFRASLVENLCHVLTVYPEVDIELSG